MPEDAAEALDEFAAACEAALQHNSQQRKQPCRAPAKPYVSSLTYPLQELFKVAHQLGSVGGLRGWVAAGVPAVSDNPSTAFAVTAYGTATAAAAGHAAVHLCQYLLCGC